MNAPRRLVTALAWFTTIYAALAVVLNLVTQSSSERAVFAPTAIILFALVLITMVGSRRNSLAHLPQGTAHPHLAHFGDLAHAR